MATPSRSRSGAAHRISSVSPTPNDSVVLGRAAHPRGGYSPGMIRDVESVENFAFVLGVPVAAILLIVPRDVRCRSKSASSESWAASWASSASSSAVSSWALVGATVGDLLGASMGDLVGVFEGATVDLSVGDLVGTNVGDFYTARAGAATYSPRGREPLTSRASRYASRRTPDRRRSRWVGGTSRRRRGR